LLAVQSGFTATEDILALTENMNGTTTEEQNDYLVGNLELADKAYTQVSAIFKCSRVAQNFLRRRESMSGLFVLDR